MTRLAYSRAKFAADVRREQRRCSDYCKLFATKQMW